MLAGTFTSVAETLDACGTNLVTVANGYAATAAATAAAIARAGGRDARPPACVRRSGRPPTARGAY